MKSKSNHNKGEEYTAELNALLQKSDGNIKNLSMEEVEQLQKLCTRKMMKDTRDAYESSYPNKGVIEALLLNETHRGRMTQSQLAQKLDVSYPHLSKVINGKERIGIHLAKSMYRNLGVDGNLLLDNA